MKSEKVQKKYSRQDILYQQVLAEQEELEQETRHVALDELFPYIGEYGKYQKLLTWLVVLPACIPCGLQGFNQLFMADELPHWCNLPDNLTQQTNFTLEQLKRLAFPTDSESGCLMRDVDWGEFLFRPSSGRSEQEGGSSSPSETRTTTRTLTDQEPRDYAEMMNELETKSWQLISCPNGWDYDGSNSIVKDFDLVCGREIYPTLALFLVNFGGLVGVFLFGMLSDIVGRKGSFFVCLTCEMIGGIGCVFARDFWTWTLFRVITGLTVPAIYQIPFIICLELVGPSYRAFVTVMTSLFYVAGMMLLPLIAYLERDWKLLSLYTTLPFLLYYGYLWFLPESPRWLLAQGRGREALEILTKLARVNGKTLPQSVVDKIGLDDHHRPTASPMRQTSKKGLLDLFRTPNMRLKTILLTLCWFANCTVYVGLSYYGPALGENPYLSFFLSSAVELPGYLLCWLLMDRWGRRWPLCLAMLLGGVFDIATVMLSSDSTTLMMIFYLTAKLGISASYLIIYPFAGELYPTEVRGLGLGFSAYIGGIGLCCIPLINYLGRRNLVLPLVVMGVLSVVGGLAGLRLPETLNAPLPQTLQEGEEFGKNFTWRDCIRCYTGMPRQGSSTLNSEAEDGDGERQEGGIPLEPLNLQHVVVEKDKVDDRSMGTQDISQMTELTPLNEGEDGRKPKAAAERPQNSSPITMPSPSSGLGSSRAQRRKLVRQGSTLEAPTDSTGAFIITPWW